MTYKNYDPTIKTEEGGGDSLIKRKYGPGTFFKKNIVTYLLLFLTQMQE